jgi:hypothetical protein
VETKPYRGRIRWHDILSQYMPTRYKVLCSIDKRYHMRSYIREVRWYIYTSLRGQVYACVIATPSHNNAQVSAVTINSFVFWELLQRRELSNYRNRVFIYLTPPHSNGSVCQYIGILVYCMFLYSYILTFRTCLYNLATPYPIVPLVPSCWPVYQGLALTVLLLIPLVSLGP